MSYEQTEIGTLVKSDPAKAAEALVALFENARGNSVHAALLAGVDHSTLKRWVNKLDKYKIQSKLEKIRQKASPRTMSDARRAELKERAAERRHVAGLQRTFDRLDDEALARLADTTGLELGELVQWREARGAEGALGPKATAKVDEALGRLMARYRSQLRSANRAKTAG